MAELLIKARDPWQITDNGTRKGDIIVVRPDGWEWGKEECLPRFIVVKTKETYEEAKKYEESLTKEIDRYDEEKKETVKEQEVVKHRKYNIDISAVDTISDEVKDFEKIRAIDLKETIREKQIGDAIKKDS
jgi:hypothetical protein